MKISFIWWFDQASSVFDNWRDGLRAAIEEIEKKHEIGWYLDKTMPDPGETDFLLFWSSSDEDYFKYLDKYKERKGICLTTDPHNMDNLRKLDVVFCESNPIYNAVRSQGLRAIKAFGTDTDFFRPSFKKKKDIDFFYPATFSPWKRQSEIAHLGSKLTCIGTVQPDGAHELTKCMESGVNVINGYLPAKEILSYYQRAKNIVIPAIHGSERTVLESMSCGIKPVVTHPENVRTYSYIKELEQSKLEPRDFIVKNYSHFKYANDLLKGICE